MDPHTPGSGMPAATPAAPERGAPTWTPEAPAPRTPDAPWTPDEMPEDAPRTEGDPTTAEPELLPWEEPPAAPPTPAPAPSQQPHVQWTPETRQLAERAYQVDNARAEIGDKFTRIAREEEADQAKLRALQGRLPPEEYDAEIAAYRQERARREAAAAKLEAQWHRCDAEEARLISAAERYRDYQALEGPADIMTIEHLVHDYAKRSGDPDYPIDEMRKRLKRYPASVRKDYARDFDADWRRRRNAVRERDGIDNVGPGGGSAGRVPYEATSALDDFKSVFEDFKRDRERARR